MAEEGVISTEQARLLEASLSNSAKHDSSESPSLASGPASERRAWFLRVLWMVGLAAVVGLIVASFYGTGPAEVQDVAASLNQSGGQGEMNRTLSTLMALFLLLVVPLLVFAYLHNSLVGKEENVSEAWAQTESNYQRRADLIPALVETVSRYLRHERETLTEVTEARAQDEARFEELIDGLIKAQQTSSRRFREEGGPETAEDPASLQGLFEA